MYLSVYSVNDDNIIIGTHHFISLITLTYMKNYTHANHVQYITFTLTLVILWFLWSRHSLLKLWNFFNVPTLSAGSN